METTGRELKGAGGHGDGMRRVALEEMALRRRRLGELTPAQERALESLLVSVADNISDLVSAAAVRAREWPPAARPPSPCAAGRTGG